MKKNLSVLVRCVFVLITVLLAVSLLSSVGFIQQAKADSTTEWPIPANPLWTYTGLYICKGDTVYIVAWDSWWITTSWHTGPGGLDPALDQPTDDRFFSGNNAQWGELIAFIDPYPGSTNGPYEEHWGDKKLPLWFPQSTGYIAVGNQVTFKSEKTGYLWLGVNDDAVSQAVSDNSGTVMVNVTIPTHPNVVGGVAVPYAKFGLSAPYIGLVSTIIAAAVATSVCVKHVKRRKENQ